MSISEQMRAAVNFSPRRLAHANLYVRDLEESERFYVDVCGLTVVFREPALRAIFLSNGSSHHDVAIMEVSRDAKPGDGERRRAKPGLNHLGFEMENEKALVDAYRRALALGSSLGHAADHGLAHSIYVHDPEQNLLEFYADTLSNWRGFFASKENQLITGPWQPMTGEEPSVEPLYHADFQVDRVPTALLHPRRIARATLLTANYEEMRRFYLGIGGLTILHEFVDHRTTILAGTTNEPALALVEAGPNEVAGLHHLGFELSDERDLDEVLDSHASTIVHATDNAAKRSVAFVSPDGLTVEFYVPRQNAFSASPTNGPRDLFLL